MIAENYFSINNRKYLKQNKNQYPLENKESNKQILRNVNVILILSLQLKVLLIDLESFKIKVSNIIAKVKIALKNF